MIYQIIVHCSMGLINAWYYRSKVLGTKIIFQLLRLFIMFLRHLVLEYCELYLIARHTKLYGFDYGGEKCILDSSKYLFCQDHENFTFKVGCHCRQVPFLLVLLCWKNKEDIAHFFLSDTTKNMSKNHPLRHSLFFNEVYSEFM